MLKIIMENSGIDMEALIHSDASNKHDMLREYLKNKENELLSDNAIEG